MIDFGGTLYYIDLVALDKAVTVPAKKDEKIENYEMLVHRNSDGQIERTEEHSSSSSKSKEIEIHKYEIIRTMIELLLDYEDEEDASLGAERALEKTPLSYKLAFNTLYNYGILKEKE